MLSYLNDEKYLTLRTKLSTINGYAKQFTWVDYSRQRKEVFLEMRAISDLYAILNLCLYGV